MAYTTINKSTDHFNTKLYTGTGAENAVTGINFQPDWVWIKNASSGSNYDHTLYDAPRGATKQLYSNQTNGQYTEAQGLKSFDSDGFTNGTDVKGNSNGSTLVSWNWKANGQGSSNTDGTINTTYTSANTTSGFSISTYSGTGSAATIGHGLGVVPQVMIVKNTYQAEHWIVYHHKIATTPQDKYIRLNQTGSRADFPMWNDTAPTNQVFSVGTSTSVNQAGGTFVAYCFAEKTGFSKFMGWSGNGSTDGTFLYTGFKPAFFMYKVVSGTTGGWGMLDNKRDTFNPVDNTLSADSGNAQADDHDVDFLSNGLKIRSAGGNINMSGADYIGMAFAKAPLVGSNNVPCTAR
jgi:hypothetical protein